ncbi:MAG: type I methionyl aminopeptidase [Candidatus Xiphinematobacter sp.]|nr:MAG: type I methionyl aminopeptidase [Candidatus Xiphinematobacter sp.]QQY09384.1 MAG: type I methionyl aminopeptidase [Candidatus Xiphinematobacter sp.]QQY10869.1 MAG: type I methionyl aminopeptidase [Candidatus Xiphinematobacter sp.]QQY11613.1 MAG: type I methionyl aminopeptidase [Candidatus Xiphinematobacter sp.]
MIPIKKSKEVFQMRLSGEVAAGILAELVGMVTPGITTKDIDEAAGELMNAAQVRSAFLGYRSFPGRICISLNEEVVHGIGSSSRHIQCGDIVKLDVGIIREGWVSDTAATITTGEVLPEVACLVSTTQRILMSAISIATAGRRLGDLSAHIEECACAAGYSVVREFVGHGIGRSLHEEPQIPNFGERGTGPILRAGMILAIEPMINAGKADIRMLEDKWTVVTADGSQSAHFEHTVLVTNEKPEILTCPRNTLLK